MNAASFKKPASLAGDLFQILADAGRMQAASLTPVKVPAYRFPRSPQARTKGAVKDFFEFRRLYDNDTAVERVIMLASISVPDLGPGAGEYYDRADARGVNTGD